MPAIRLLPPASGSAARVVSLSDSLPRLLRTASGLAVIEIQGTLHLPATPGDGSQADSGQMGRLVFPLLRELDGDVPSREGAWMKTVHFYVGRNQRLTGQVKKLAKPLGVVRRRERQSSSVDDDDSTADEVEVVDIVRYKLLFSSRPEPVGEDQ